MKFNILIFVDNLMVFCKANRKFINIMIKLLDTFTWVLGLHVNKERYEVVCGGISKDQKQKFVANIGYTEGNFPLTYLGLLITSVS